MQLSLKFVKITAYACPRNQNVLRGGSRNFLKGVLYTIVVTFNAKNNFIQLFFRKNKKKITKKFCPKGGLQPPSPLPWIRLWCSTTKPPLDTPRKYFGNLDGKADENLTWEFNLYARVCLYSVHIPFTLSPHFFPLASGKGILEIA